MSFFSSNFVRLSNSLKVIESSKNQADSSFATEIRDENLDRVMNEMYNRTVWTINRNSHVRISFCLSLTNDVKFSGLVDKIRGNISISVGKVFDNHERR